MHSLSNQNTSASDDRYPHLSHSSFFSFSTFFLSLLFSRSLHFFSLYRRSFPTKTHPISPRRTMTIPLHPFSTSHRSFLSPPSPTIMPSLARADPSTHPLSKSSCMRATPLLLDMNGHLSSDTILGRHALFRENHSRVLRVRCLHTLIHVVFKF